MNRQMIGLNIVGNDDALKADRSLAIHFQTSRKMLVRLTEAEAVRLRGLLDLTISAWEGNRE